MKKIVLLLLLLQIAGFVVAQKSQTDILLDRLKTAREDFHKVDILNQLTEIYCNESPETALHYGVQALELARELETSRGIALSLQNLGSVCRNLGKYELALDYQQQALTLYESLQDKKGIVSTLNDIVVTFTTLGKYEQAMAYKFRSLEIDEEAGNETGIARSLNEMGDLYARLGNYELALSNCLKAMKIREKLNNKGEIADSYSTLGTVYAKSGNYVLALQNMRRALEMYKSLGNRNQEGIILNDLGEVYTKMDHHEQAAAFYKNSLLLEESSHNKRGIAVSLINLGKTYISLRDFEQAIAYLTRALQTAREVNSKNQVEESYTYLSEAYEKAGDSPKALEYYKLFTAYRDTIFSETNSRQIAEMHDLFESERKEKEIMLLNKENEIRELALKEANAHKFFLLSLIGFMVILVGLAVYVIRLKNRANEQLAIQNALIQHKNEELRELNITKDKFFSIIAHDLKGPLNSLTGFSSLVINYVEYLSKDEIKKMAVDLDKAVRNLYDLLTNLLTWSRSQMNAIEFTPKPLPLVQLCNETINLSILNANHKNIELLHNVSEDICIYADENSVRTILRNLVSNALKFTRAGGTVMIEAERKGSFVDVSVSDTGVGMSQEVIEKIFRIDSKHSTTGTNGEAGTGLGLVLCKEFVEKNGGSISVESIINKGTKFHFMLPAGANGEVKVQEMMTA